MKKVILIIGIFAIIFIAGCANQKYYFEETDNFKTWSQWTGIILLIQIIITLISIFLSNPKKAVQAFLIYSFSFGLSTVLGHIILAEWGFRFNHWMLGSIVGKIIMVICGLLSGWRFEFSIQLWGINAFSWHSIEIYKWGMIPALFSWMIYFFLVIRKVKKAQKEMEE